MTGPKSTANHLCFYTPYLLGSICILFHIKEVCASLRGDFPLRKTVKITYLIKVRANLVISDRKIIELLELVP